MSMSSKDLGAEQTDRSCSEVYRSFVEQVFGEHANKHAAVPVVGFGLDRMLNCAQCEWTLSVQSGEVRACAYEREPVGKSSLLCVFNFWRLYCSCRLRLSRLIQSHIQSGTNWSVRMRGLCGTATKTSSSVVGAYARAWSWGLGHNANSYQLLMQR